MAVVTIDKYEFPAKDIINFQKGLDEGINPEITTDQIIDLLDLYGNIHIEDWNLTDEDLEKEFEDINEGNKELIIKTLSELTRQDLENARFYMLNDGAELFNVDEDYIYLS